jgi:hypothetical protein
MKSRHPKVVLARVAVKKKLAHQKFQCETTFL